MPKKVLFKCEQVIYPLFNSVSCLKNRDNSTANTARCADKCRSRRGLQAGW